MKESPSFVRFNVTAGMTPEGTDHHLYDDAADGTADWRKDAYWATEGGGRLNALVDLTDENSRIHQKKPGMSIQHPLENNRALQRDSANTIGRRRSATSIIADYKRKNVLRIILHEDHLSEHYGPTSGLVLEMSPMEVMDVVPFPTVQRKLTGLTDPSIK